jgi:signal transduction histidine kinase
LGQALNQLAERIEDLVAAERENVADLGHRLRTPLTALRIDAEMITDPALAARLGEHIDHLQRSVDTVVREARRTVREPLPAGCDLAAVASGRAAFWTPLAEDQGRALSVRVASGSGPFPVPVAEADLTEAIDTALDNVFAHTPDGSPIAIVVGHEGSDVVLAVEDAGPGLPEAYAGRGVSGTGSTGLGLSIITRIVEHSGGRLDLRPSALGGLSVAMRWPAATRSDRLGRTSLR